MAASPSQPAGGGARFAWRLWQPIGAQAEERRALREEREGGGEALRGGRGCEEWLAEPRRPEGGRCPTLRRAVACCVPWGGSPGLGTGRGQPQSGGDWTFSPGWGLGALVEGLCSEDWFLGEPRRFLGWRKLSQHRGILGEDPDPRPEEPLSEDRCFLSTKAVFQKLLAPARKTQRKLRRAVVPYRYLSGPAVVPSSLTNSLVKEEHNAVRWGNRTFAKAFKEVIYTQDYGGDY